MKKLGKLNLHEMQEQMLPIPESVLNKIRGGEVTVTFDRSDGMIYIEVNGQVVDSYIAHNNTTSTSEGQWPNGTYSMYDQNSSHYHTGSDLDTYNGPYGEHGIYRANYFCDPNGDMREGMGLHAGRANEEWGSPTNGCIRTTEAAMDAIACYIGSYGSFTTITVQD
ncbi:hypothetical protein EYV94_15340 [Puteibacter caeruleilacunae]|nr:hypothetical protein EYV94_15340 [Puteibacter caeruleilacunae]